MSIVLISYQTTYSAHKLTYYRIKEGVYKHTYSTNCKCTVKYYTHRRYYMWFQIGRQLIKKRMKQKRMTLQKCYLNY